MKLSIIIPVYNEEKTINEVVERIYRLDNKKFNYEIIVVNDGSKDNTEKILQKAKKKFRDLHIVTLKNNQGKGIAIKAGANSATGDWILIQDGDMEYDPVYIPLLADKLGKGKAQVVYGTRLNRMPNIFKEENKPLFLIHYMGNRFLSLLVSLLYGTWLTDIETGYKLLPKDIFQKFNLKAKGFEFEAEITVKLLKQKYKIIEVPIKTIPRGYKDGKKLKTIPAGIHALFVIVKERF